MRDIFSVTDRQHVLDDILSITMDCPKIVSLVQVGSGAVGYHDARSDLDFVIALDSDESMLDVMAYIHQKISEKFEILYFSQEASSHLQCYLLSNLLEIDLGYGGYDHAAARKPAFRVLFDNTGVVEEKMIRSRAWMDDRIYGEKQKKDITLACNSIWAHLMHAAVAIHRGSYFRAIGELEFVRTLYIDLLGDRYRLESTLNREIDSLPEEEKTAILSTYATEVSAGALWASLSQLTDLIYRELEGCDIPVTKEMLLDYERDLR